MSTATRPLGRKTPIHYDHVEAHPLTDEQVAKTTIQPVAPGANWYTGFDTPVQGKDGLWRLPAKRLGTIRGGHCFCLVPPSMLDRLTDALWLFFNQGEEGACEGFGHAKRSALIHGKTFDAFRLYDDGQRIEGTYQPNGGSADNGSTNDAICQALRKWGVHTQEGAVAHRSSKPDAHPLALTSYAWATSADQILAVLGITDGGEIPLSNSWGKEYPKTVYMDPAVLERLLREGGECDVDIGA